MRNSLQTLTGRELAALFDVFTTFPQVTALTVHNREEVTRLDVSCALAEYRHGADMAASLSTWCRWSPRLELAACMEDVVRTNNDGIAARAEAALLAEPRLTDAERNARLDRAETRIAEALACLDAVRAAGGAYVGDLADVMRALDARTPTQTAALAGHGLPVDDSPHTYGAGTRLSECYTKGRNGEACPVAYRDKSSAGWAAWRRGAEARKGDLLRTAQADLAAQEAERDDLAGLSPDDRALVEAWRDIVEDR